MICFSILNMFAASLELTGAFFLANHYLKIRARNIPKVLMSSLFRGRVSNLAANLSQLAGDDPVISLRGIAFLALGFTIQIVSSIGQIIVAL